jgi:hypothetical protein
VTTTPGYQAYQGGAQGGAFSELWETAQILEKISTLFKTSGCYLHLALAIRHNGPLSQAAEDGHISPWEDGISGNICAVPGMQPSWTSPPR